MRDGEIGCQPDFATDNYIDEELAELPLPHELQNKDVPNGGLTAWLQVLGSFFLFFNSWGIINSFGVYQTYYMLNLSQSPSNISWIGSIQSYIPLAVGVIIGPIYDAGYVRHLLIVGTFLTVFGMMMTSICTAYWQVVLAQAFCVGIGAGCIYLPSIAILPTYFSTRKALASGIAASGSSVGGVLFPIIFKRLEPRVGFGWATRIIAFTMLGTLIISNFTIKMRVSPPQKRKLWQSSAFKDTPFAIFTVGIFFDFIGLYFPFFYIESFARTQSSMSEYSAGYLFSILNAASILGRIIPSFIADYTGPLNVLIPSTLLASIVAFSWLAVKSPAGLVVFCVFYGFFSGSFVAIPPTVLVTLSPNPSVIGTRMGMSYALGGLGVLIGTPVAGQLLEHVGFEAAIGFCGAVVAAGTVSFVATRVAKVGWGFSSIA